MKSYSDEIHKAGLGHAYKEKIKTRRKGKARKEERDGEIRKGGKDEGRKQAQKQNRTLCFYQAIFLLSALQTPLSLQIGRASCRERV